MNLIETMQALESKANANAQKTYRRHGVQSETFGVLYADLYALQKRIKRDQELAEALWETGNHDARILATLIADPAQASKELLERWVGAVDNYGLGMAVTDYAAQTPIALQLMAHWMQSDDEWFGQAGWGIFARSVSEEGGLSDAQVESHLQTIQAEIHTRKNRVRHTMNAALIAIGLRNAHFEARAIEVAKTIGKVSVDHGNTGCKTPDAIAYIQKVKARKAGKKP
jgi:3-methyladenine DNA glycosylase AlkD